LALLNRIHDLFHFRLSEAMHQLLRSSRGLILRSAQGGDSINVNL
jgi:hypothetical protein